MRISDWSSDVCSSDLRPVDDRDCTRGAPEQNRLGKRPVQRSLEPLDMGACPDHEISAPPPKLKKLRKNEEAAKAIDSPKMIWMRRRNADRKSTRLNSSH